VEGETYRDVRRAIQTCSGCHFLSRGADANMGMSRETALSLVRRMSEKLAAPLDEGAMISVADGYRSIMASLESMKRLVPHDRPVLDKNPSHEPGGRRGGYAGR
jgi:hypothetical protein